MIHPARVEDLEQPLVNMRFRKLIYALEEKINSLPGALGNDPFPLKHTFAEGVYIRELTIPKGFFCIGKLHRHSYINCFLKGDMTILTEEGIKRIQAPCSMIAPAGTKRFGYSHEEVVWITVHPNPMNITDIETLEKEIHIDDYEALPGHPIDIGELEESIEVDEIFNTLVKQIVEISFNPQVFRELTKKIYAHEKEGFWSDWTVEQQTLYMSGDWEAFSKSRGYTSEEISDVKLWIQMMEDGIKQGFSSLDIIKDLSLRIAARNFVLDKNGEILKSSHIPSNKKISYKEVIC